MATRDQARPASKLKTSRDGVPALYDAGVKELIGLAEKKLQGRIVEPLLRALGFSNVQDTSGPMERGKDLIATKYTEFGATELYAIQIKKYKATGKATASRSLGHLLVQLKQAVLEPVLDPSTNVRRPPDRLVFITPYPLPHHAREAFHELSKDAGLRPVEVVDGVKLFELIREHTPDAISNLSLETQYRLRVVQVANEIPESTIAFQLREGLRLEDIWVEASIGPGDRSLYVLAYRPPFEDDVIIDITLNTLEAAVASYEKWAGSPPNNKYIVKPKEDRKKKGKKGKEANEPKIDPNMVRVNVDQLLDTPRTAVTDMLKGVASLSAETLEDERVCAIAARTIEVLSGTRSLLRTRLIESLWNAMDSRVTDVTSLKHTANIPSPTLLRLRQCVYVVGGPGSGKTTLFRKLSIHQARGRDQRLPIYLPLVDLPGDTPGHIARACASVFDDLSHRRGTQGPSVRDFKGLLQDGDVVLFLDGLDETGSSMAQVLGSIDELAQTYPKTQIFLSCRDTFGFPHWYRAFTVSLEPFNDKQLRAFIGRWFTSQPTQRSWLLKWLQRNSRMSEVARTPLFAALLCSLVEIDEDMPTTEFELYERRFDLLLGRWERAKGISPLPKAVRDSYMYLLMSLAFHLHSHERRTGSDEEINRLANRYQVRKFHTRPEQVIEDCVRRGLLMREPSGGFSLGHLTYQEYLAGVWLAGQNPVAFVWSRMLSPWWDKTLEFYATARKEIDLLLRESLRYRISDDVMERIRYLMNTAWMTSKGLVKEVEERYNFSQHQDVKDSLPQIVPNTQGPYPRLRAFDWKKLPKPPIVLPKSNRGKPGHG